MFHFHSRVLWGRTTDTGPIRGRICKPTRGIRQRCDAGVRIQRSEDVPLQWRKFASAVCLRSTVTARRQLLGIELGRFVLTWAAWTEMFSNCGQPMSVQPLRHTRNTRPCLRAPLHLSAKAEAMASTTETKTDLRKWCCKIGKWYKDVKYRKLQEMSSLLRWVCLSLVFIRVAREFDSQNWWGRKSSLCARRWLNTTLHVRQSLCDITW